jgi:rare lipoprotein A
MFRHRALTLVLLPLAGCAGARSAATTPPPFTEVAAAAPGLASELRAIDRGRAERGMASWYGRAHHGRRTASGERFDRMAMTAAHRTLPFGTVVRVTEPESGRSVTVRITDRGPFSRGRVLDLSEAAAAELGIHGRGVAPVVIETVRPDPT